MSSYPEEWVDGQRVAPRFIDEDMTLTERYRGGIVVRGGAVLRLVGRHQGSLIIEAGATAIIASDHQGSVSVSSGGTVTIEARHQGSLDVAAGGLARAVPSGRIQGPIQVEGILINEGARGGPVSGGGEIRDMPGSRVVHPVTRGDATYYEW